MRQRTEDMIGKKYGKLTVISIDHWRQISTGKRAYVKCKCDCGNEKVVLAYSLTQGITLSCGCLQKERASEAKRTHGKSQTRLYKIFHGMHKRCENSKSASFKDYGERGIRVCEEWSGDDGFQSFYEWSMKNRYSEDLSIDRIDYNGNYEPSNCRWTDATTQANNSRWNTNLEYKGEIHTIAEWAKITGIKPHTISGRIRYGWSIPQALGYEKREIKHSSEVIYTINGESHNIREWCKIRGLSVDTVRYRREHGWSSEEIFGFKERKHG